MQDRSDSVHDFIDQFAGGPKSLESVISGLSEKDLDLALSGDSWTIREYIHHIVDGDDIWKSFIKQAVGCQGGSFSLAWYWQIPQDGWAKAWDYAGRAVEPSLALFHASRAHVVQLLRQIPGALEKSLLIRMPDGNEQPVSVAEIIEMQMRHLDGHIADIQGILKTR